jgi:hypothetical protein
MKIHGNSLKNEAPHHLYTIEDTVENDTFKYGVSHDLIEEDGLSKRVRQQVDLLYRAVGFLRFIGRILIFNIPGIVRRHPLCGIQIGV